VNFAIPTPSTSVVEIGPFTFHFYALCIIAGIAAAIWIAHSRFIHSYPECEGVVADVAIFAIPAGVLGGRLYHVLTSLDQYFGRDKNPLEIFAIWKGGLGIWGAISLGALGAWISYSKISQTKELPPFAAFADALAPGLLIAQAIGRWGNWFNGELFGRPLNAPWALEIPYALRPSSYAQYETFHPTFLYESIWCVILALLLIFLKNRFPAGSIFWLYVSGYGLGRFFIEGLRIDSAHVVGGLRLNQYVSLICIAGGIVAFNRISRSTR
jgi:prolipoprotein diacylglyceryl transferase